MKVTLAAVEVRAFINMFKEIDKNIANNTGVDAVFEKLNITYVEFMATVAFGNDLVIRINEADIVLVVEIYTDLIAGIAPSVIAMGKTFKRFSNNIDGLDKTATPPVITLGDFLLTSRKFENSPFVEPIIIEEPIIETVTEESRQTLADKLISIFTNK
jgi:hypothetical protein